VSTPAKDPDTMSNAPALKCADERMKGCSFDEGDKQM
jgi:hypothetical protein